VLADADGVVTDTLAPAAVLAFIPLTFSVFWGSLAYTLIGGTAVGTVLTLVFLPALYSIWFRIRQTDDRVADHVAVLHSVGSRKPKSQAWAMPQA
jgi:hypothetical protein